MRFRPDPTYSILVRVMAATGSPSPASPMELYSESPPARRRRLRMANENAAERLARHRRRMHGARDSDGRGRAHGVCRVPVAGSGQASVVAMTPCLARHVDCRDADGAGRIQFIVSGGGSVRGADLFDGGQDLGVGPAVSHARQRPGRRVV